MSKEGGVTVDFDCETLNSREIRRFYHTTYSQVNSNIVLSRDSFSGIVLEAFEKKRPDSSRSVIQWVCSREEHSHSGVHYHVAVKLS